jgi:hypothetical protein
MLPEGYPNYKTVHRRFQQWCREDVLRKVLTDLANALRDEGEVEAPQTLKPASSQELREFESLPLRHGMDRF